MVKTLPKIISIISALVLLFVINTRPLFVSAADTPDLTLVETELSASEVAELVAGEVAVGVILIIVGFIALTYVTLRNVDAPIQFSSEQSFFDKCHALGQYMLDHIDDNVKDVIYSVYQFVTAGNITSISSVPKLNLTAVGKFFAKIGAWLGGSFVSGVNTITQGFLDSFSNNPFSAVSSYSYTSEFVSIYNDYSSIPYTSTFGSFTKFGTYYAYSFSIPSDTVLVFSVSSSYITAYPYILSSDGSYLTRTSFSSLKLGFFRYASVNNDGNVAPNLGSYSAVSWNNASGTAALNLGSGYYIDAVNLLQYLLSFGVSVYVASELTSTLYSSDLTTISEVTTSTSSDTVTVPLSDELVLQIADIAAAAAAGTIATTKDYYDELIAGLALTITSALSGSNFTMPEGDYYIPSLDNIWKYVEYMFSTLGSWIIFAGKCIQCVTVGEGGLSWIFYGGFIFLICGGIVGKILLG